MQEEINSLFIQVQSYDDHLQITGKMDFVLSEETRQEARLLIELGKNLARKYLLLKLKDDSNTNSDSQI